MKNKKFIIIFIVIIILGIVAWQFFGKNEKPKFELSEVKYGTVVQEISETGKVIKGETINLNFKNSGRIEKIYVEVGEEVKTGDILAKLEISNLNIQLQDAKAALSLVQAKFDKLLTGASKEEIQAAQTKVKNGETDLEEARQSLENTYEDALNVLDDAHLKSYNAFNVIDIIQRTYFIGSDQESVKVKEKKDEINAQSLKIKNYTDTAKASSENEKTDLAISEVEKSLNIIFSDLGDIREICESENYRNTVSSANKTLLDTQRTNINTSLASITDSQQAISSAKLSIISAEGLLQVAKDSLALLTASPRKEDVDLYQAQIDQAQSQVQLLENQIQDSILRSPIKGQIATVEKRVGELAQPTQGAAFTILPDAPFEIKVDIYEEDVIKMEIGNSVDISLVAFPNKTFRGSVAEIDPTEKIIEGVVYYETTIDSEELPEGIKPGMTADLTIRTALKENVLTIPRSALQEKDNKDIIEIFDGKSAQQKEIKIGLKGSNDLIEVVSGLTEGEKVIVQ